MYARVAPKPGRALGPDGQASALRGDAPWALSALPECLTQTSESNGSLQYVRARLPAGAVRIEPGSHLTYGDCTIDILGDEAVVRRASDRLRIPPHAEFYRSDGSLALLRQADGTVELRVYEPAGR